MRIAIDVDDVVLNLMDSWLDRYNKIKGTSFQKHQMKDWDLVKNGLEPEVYNILRVSGDDIYWNATPVDGVHSAIRLIEQAGYEIIYVTSAVSGTIDAKIEALEKHGFLKKSKSIDDRLIVAGRKYLVDADILIDDKPENIIKWPYPRKGILFNQPWNENIMLLPERAVRCDGWREVLEHLGLVRG